MMIRLLAPLLILLPVQTAAAQGVFLPRDEVAGLVSQAVEAAASDGVPMAAAAVANGAQVTALTEIGAPDAGPPVRYRLGRVSSLYLAVVAHLLIEDGALGLDAPVNRHLPDALQVDDGRFGPVRVHHLLAQTGGFARMEPGLLTRDPQAVAMSADEAARFVAQWRSPGRAPDFDPIGLGLLARVIEGVTGEPYAQVLADRVLTPLGLAQTGLDLQIAPPLADCVLAPGDCTPLQARAFLRPVFGITASADDLAQFAAALTRRDFPGRKARQRLFTRQAGLNPAAPGVTHGLMVEDLRGRRAFSLASNEAGAKAVITLMPPQGIAVVAVAATAQAAPPAQDYAAARFAARLPLAVANRYVPPTRDWLTDGAAAGEADRATDAHPGRYAPAQGSPHLAFAMLERPIDSLSVRAARDGDAAGDRLSLRGRTLSSVRPGVYRGPEGRRAVFGTDAAEGFLRWNDTLYVTAPVVSDPMIMTLPVLIATALMASLVVYLLSPFDAHWLRFARLGLVGFFFYLLGVGLDVEFWPTVWLDWGAGWLVVLWRLVFTVGMTLLLAVPLLSADLVRRAALPKGPAAPLVLAHLVVLSAAALVLVMTSLGWGYAGDLTP